MTIATILFSMNAYIALSPEELEKQLNKAQRVEMPGCIPLFYTTGAGAQDVEFAHLSALARGDGIWVCCRGLEIQLRHYHGRFPFKHLKCGTCDHLICKKCKTSEILEVVKCEALELRIDTNLGVLVSQNVGVLVGQICPSCGLSHRANLHKKKIRWAPNPLRSPAEACSCGEVAKSDWLKFVIGEPLVYRMNPVEAAHYRKMSVMQAKWQNRDGGPRDHSRPEQPRPRQPRPEQQRFQQSRPQLTHPQQAHPQQTRPEPQPDSLRLQSDPSPYLHDSAQNTPTVLSTIPQARRPAGLTINIQDLPPERILATPRSATWSPGDQHQQVDIAETFVKNWIGTMRYEQVKGTLEGELMIDNARRIIMKDHINYLSSLPCTWSFSLDQSDWSSELPCEQWAWPCAELFKDNDASFAQTGLDRIERLVRSRDQRLPPPVVGLPASPMSGRRPTERPSVDEVSEAVEHPTTPFFAEDLPATWEFYKAHITGTLTQPVDEYAECARVTAIYERNMRRSKKP